MNTEELVQRRFFFARLVFGFALLSLGFRFFLKATPLFWQNPPLFEFIFDYSYWTLQLSGMRSLLLEQQWASVLFQVLLFGSCILCVAFPLKRVFPMIFFFLFLVYALSYNSVIVHHAHPLTILTLVSLPFTVRDHKLWYLLWQGFRYYVCFAYAASFVWKVTGGSLWDPLMGENSFKANLVNYMYLYPDTTWSAVYRWFITHPGLLQAGAVTVFLMEGLMTIGFVTRRWDRFLFWLPILIHGATYFFADVFFIEMWVGALAFLTDKQVLEIQSFFNRNKRLQT